MGFLQPFLQYAITYTPKPKPKVQGYMYRDQLNKKQEAPVRIKKKVRFESKVLLQSDESKKSSETGNGRDDVCGGVADSGDKSRIQIKILMTKEEAARLLSKCKHGGILEFKDVANTLVHIPNNRVDLVSHIMKDK